MVVFSAPSLSHLGQVPLPSLTPPSTPSFLCSQLPGTSSQPRRIDEPTISKSGCSEPVTNFGALVADFHFDSAPRSNPSILCTFRRAVNCSTQTCLILLDRAHGSRCLIPQASSHHQLLPGRIQFSSQPFFLPLNSISLARRILITTSIVSRGQLVHLPSNSLAREILTTTSIVSRGKSSRRHASPPAPRQVCGFHVRRFLLSIIPPSVLKNQLIITLHWYVEASSSLFCHVILILLRAGPGSSFARISNSNPRVSPVSRTPNPP
ncbi:MAG: hypothetical protein JWR01_2885 [Subtercola sp.]|nr:hypothetical protein [Subtercola sp.]